MKKYILFFMSLVMVFSLCACGKNEAVTGVEELINQIGTVSVESESAINAADSAFNALNEDEKGKVENYHILVAAKEEFSLLSAEANKANVDEAVKWIKIVDEQANKVANYIIDGWTTNAQVMNYYFDPDYKNKDINVLIKFDVSETHRYRDHGHINLTTAKELLEFNGTDGYYEAAKNYYIEVAAFLDFVSTFPEGYSMLTYSQAVSTYRHNCEEAAAELSFYK